MFTTYNLPQTMPILYSRRKIFTRIFISLLFFNSYFKSYALSTNRNNTINSYTNNFSNKVWSLYPFSIQITIPQVGIIMPLHLLDVATNNTSNKKLITIGTRLDVGLLYPRKWILKHFDCYPKLGLLFKYDYITGNKIDQKGYIIGSVFYIEPNYNHLRGWEILPRFGVGVSYLTIPGAYSSIEQETDVEGESESKTTTEDTEPFRKEPSLNILLDILLKYRLTPNWHLYFSIGVDYLPYFSKKENNSSEPSSRIERSIKIYTASLGGSYTFNPNPNAPNRKLTLKKNRIDAAFLSSFRKPDMANESSEEDDNKYCYIGGLHTQWSYQFFNSQAIVLGSEWIKDQARKKELKNAVKKDNLQVSFIVGHEFLWGDLIFGQYAGIYALNNASANTKSSFKNLSNLLYLRLGLNYKITNYLYLGTNLKISIFPPNIEKKPLSIEYTRIDYLDFRIGYTF